MPDNTGAIEIGALTNDSFRLNRFRITRWVTYYQHFLRTL
jgi:hypothetical protein